MFSGLGQDLDGDVVRDQIVIDQVAQEFEFRFRCGREADFDFLKAHGDQDLVKFDFFFQIHRDDKGLISVAQIDATPDRRLFRIFPLRPGHIDDRRHKITFLVMFYVFHGHHSYDYEIN